MTLGAESADRLGRESVAVLWFLGVYLVLLAFVPALTRLRNGRAVAIVAFLLLLAAAVDGVGFATGSPESGLANFLVVWLIPVVSGVAYARKLMQPWVALVIGTAEMSNVSPPTLLLALHCTWMCCAFVAAAGAINRCSASGSLVVGARGRRTGRDRDDMGNRLLEPA